PSQTAPHILTVQADYRPPHRPRNRAHADLEHTTNQHRDSTARAMMEARLRALTLAEAEAEIEDILNLDTTTQQKSGGPNMELG
ncbi:hypothetical protein LINGRAPRIM_LOCUS2788, partial [Linum grandiflorum]